MVRMTLNRCVVQYWSLGGELLAEVAPAPLLNNQNYEGR